MAKIYIISSEWTKESDKPTHVIADVMFKIRRISIDKFSTLEEMINIVIKSSSSFSLYPLAVHMVLDSYIEFSLKECERLRRNSENGIDVVNKIKEYPTPKQNAQFWCSEQNKQNIIFLCREMVKNGSLTSP